MGKAKALVKVHPEGKYVVDVEKEIDIADLTPGARVALRNDSYALHILLPSKIDPLVRSAPCALGLVGVPPSDFLALLRAPHSAVMLPNHHHHPCLPSP